MYKNVNNRLHSKRNDERNKNYWVNYVKIQNITS